MASEQHGRHKFAEVADVFKTKQDDIKKDTKKLENHISPTYEEIARDLENQLANLDGGYEKLTTTMSKQGEQWHREIDIIINKMKTEINEIKVKHRDILQKHLDEIKQIQSLIKQTLEAIRKIEKSTEVSSTIEYSSKVREFSKLPPKVKVSLPIFIPKPIDCEKLYSLFGQITPLSTATEENVLSLNKPFTSVRELLDEPKLETTIQTFYKKLRSVTSLNGDKIWTCGETNDIKCFNIKGSLLQKIQKKSVIYPYDIAVKIDGDLLYTCGATDTVNKIKNGQTEKLIRLQGWKPFQLCVTSTGDLLITLFSNDKTQSKVVCYSGCTEKQTIQFDNEGKPLYSGKNYTKYITENRNHDICVADWAAGAVVVVNQDGKLRWRYTGKPSVTKNKAFKPYGITADSQSHILTADSANSCIHILDQNGQFLRYIDNCNLKNPNGLYVDNNDNLFVCCCNEFRRMNFFLALAGAEKYNVPPSQPPPPPPPAPLIINPWNPASSVDPHLMELLVGDDSGSGYHPPEFALLLYKTWESLGLKNQTYHNPCHHPHRRLSLIINPRNPGSSVDPHLLELLVGDDSESGYHPPDFALLLYKTWIQRNQYACYLWDDMK
uniref:Tripartite motif-containing protein 3 n=1 Tax=Magallana gigas TaxID=29159 RepID=K1R8L3_MAGGI